MHLQIWLVKYFKPLKVKVNLTKMVKTCKGFYDIIKMLLQNGFKPIVEGCVNVPKKRVMLCGKTGRNGWWESFWLEDVVQVLNSKISWLKTLSYMKCWKHFWVGWVFQTWVWNYEKSYQLFIHFWKRGKKQLFSPSKKTFSYPPFLKGYKKVVEFSFITTRNISF